MIPPAPAPAVPPYNCSSVTKQIVCLDPLTIFNTRAGKSKELEHMSRSQGVRPALSCDVSGHAPMLTCLVPLECAAD